MRTLPFFLLSTLAWSQAALAPPGPAPTLEEVRKGMGIPSTMEVRGQQDALGFASRADQMAKVWEFSAAPPDRSLGPRPAPGLAGAICPHDDYLFAGRVYRQVLPLVTARTVVLVGVFHKYRRFGIRDRLVLDPYRAWCSPEGEIPVSPLRSELLGSLKPESFLQDAAMHDSEHSLEALAYWLRHARPDLEILPVMVPAMAFPRMEALSSELSRLLAESMKRRGWILGRDVAIVMSSDAVHYGADFKFTPQGEGGVEAYVKACNQDRALLTGPLAGPVSTAKTRAFFSACVDPDRPEDYRLTWCGRFAIPFGLLLLQETASRLGQPVPVGHPIAYDTSIGSPELPVKPMGMGATAPANLYRFVGYPAAGYVVR